MTKQYKGAIEGASDPAQDAFIITASDATVFGVAANTAVTRAIYVGTTGDVNVVTANGSTVLFNNVPVGIFPISVKQVLATSTTASNLVGLV